MKYDYLETMVSDIESVKDEYDFDFTEENFDMIYDKLYVSDAVTGNKSGKYVDDKFSKMCVCDNMSLLMQALDSFCVPYEEVGKRFYEEDWAYFDVTIRCYLLDEALITYIRKQET